MATTPDGKAISSRNSTTHGVFSQQTVLPHLGEDPAHFDALLSELTAQYAPRTALDHHYVAQIARALWRLRRLSRWENELLADPDLPDDERRKQWERVLRLDAMLRRQIDKAVKVLTAPAAQNCQNELSSEISLTPAQSRRPLPKGKGKELILSYPFPLGKGQGIDSSGQGIGSSPEGAKGASPSIAALRRARQQKLRKRTG